MVDVDDLRLGSLVRLASGSPKMTVTSVVQDDADPRFWLVHVVWYSERLGIQRDHFPPNLLVYPRVAFTDAAPEEGAE